MSQTEHILARLPGDVLGSLRRTDASWRQVRSGELRWGEVVLHDSERLGSVDWDVLICGGTLGIFIGAALVRRGWRVALIERGVLRGREQEWNVSRSDLDIFVDLGLLRVEELERAMSTRIERARVGFPGSKDLWVQGVLDIGVDPVFLIETLKQNFLAGGGQLFERTGFERATVHPDGVRVHTALSRFTVRLLIDGMGHTSPITYQARRGRKPDGVCLVVGSCAAGYPASNRADLIVSLSPIARQCQYFWEAFPAREGRTTYLFTYLDAHPKRFGLEELFEDYLQLLPGYQNVDLDQLQWRRALFGWFPSYRSGGIGSFIDRVLAVGDSSGSQSPLSFGGFGAMVRHLGRLDDAIDEALRLDLLDCAALDGLQPYQPNLAVTWLFQKAMSVGIAEQTDPQRINRLLAVVFSRMQGLGDDVLRPFLQDVVQWRALSQTLFAVARADPVLVAGIVAQVGPVALIEWTAHYLSLAAYTTLDLLAEKLAHRSSALPPRAQYRLHRLIDAWKYGSGGDLKRHEAGLG